MADSVKFSRAYCRDGTYSQTLEDAIRRAGTLAGIHHYDFQDAIDDGFTDVVDWDNGASVGNQFQLTGGGAAKWWLATHTIKHAPSFTASFDLISGSGAFFFKKATGDTRCYAAWWTGSTIGFCRIDTNGAATNLISLPITLSPPARLCVAVRYSLDSVDDERMWLLASLFFDGQCVTGMSDDLGDTAYNWDGNGLGFAVYNNNVLTVDNFTVSNIARIVDWCSVDQGEAAAAGVSRAVGTTRVMYMARFDEMVRVWRPENRSLDWAIAGSRGIQLMSRKNRTDVLTHVRALGALYETDVFFDGEGDAHMHRFGIHNDPNVMTRDETYYEGYRVLHDSKEDQEAITLVGPPNPLLEVHDRITYNGVSYRVMSITVNLTEGRKGPQIRTIIRARRYYTIDVGTDIGAAPGRI